jgi:hypothetical protein
MPFSSERYAAATGLDATSTSIAFDEGPLSQEFLFARGKRHLAEFCFSAGFLIEWHASIAMKWFSLYF